MRAWPRQLLGCLAVLALALTACTASKTMLEGVAVPVEDMNRAMQVYIPLETTLSGENKSLAIVVENQSAGPIEINAAEGIHLFQQVGHEWRPIANAASDDAGWITLQPQEQATLVGQAQTLMPGGTGSQATVVLVVVVGTLDNQPVAAYANVPLQP